MFHSTAWLRALRSACGYESVAFTTSPLGSPLDNAAVFCPVRSIFTGNRLVSLPYADHCAVLENPAGELTGELMKALPQLVSQQAVQGAEFRPSAPLPDIPVPGMLRAEEAYVWHTLDLTPDLTSLRARLHRDSIHRKIRRAEREGLLYQSGWSEDILRDFYGLLLRTRRRHRLPPHPERWFRALRQGFADDLRIRVARLGGRPVAAILTLRHREVLLFKYGCSDERFHAAGGTPMLLWRTIQEAREEGLRALDLGRSDLAAQGLIVFKDRWGAARRTLHYVRFAARPEHLARFRFASAGSAAPWARRVVAALPGPLFRAAGAMLFPHLG